MSVKAPKTIEERLAFLFDTREQMKDLERQKSDLQKSYDEVEYGLVQDMETAGIKSAGIDKCTATLKQEKYPQIVDMPAFVQWCAAQGLEGMIQKRVSKGVFDEFFKENFEYPDGIDTYDKVTLGIRKR